ncbi:MAG: hypothetical protein MZV64_72340 [Ignavibacteriales bacterium]|nr:hypothetical protein [Ignavibacteriales bacterium]
MPVPVSPMHRAPSASVGATRSIWARTARIVVAAADDVGELVLVLELLAQVDVLAREALFERAHLLPGARILDRDGRLGGERLEQAPVVGVVRAAIAARAEQERARDAALRRQRNQQRRAERLQLGAQRARDGSRSRPRDP